MRSFLLLLGFLVFATTANAKGFICQFTLFNEPYRGTTTREDERDYFFDIDSCEKSEQTLFSAEMSLFTPTIRCDNEHALVTVKANGVGYTVFTKKITNDDSETVIDSARFFVGEKSFHIRCSEWIKSTNMTDKTIKKYRKIRRRLKKYFRVSQI